MPRPSRSGIRGLYFDADGRARIDLRYVDSKGAEQRYKEVFPLGTPKAAARVKAQTILAESVAGTLKPRGEAHPVTLDAAFKEYLEWCATNRANADPKYKERHRDHWIKTLGAGLSLAALDARAIEKHKARRTKQGKGPGTINRELVTIKHFLRLAAEWSWIERAPKVVLLQEPAGRVRWLTSGERGALAKALAKPQREAFRRVVSAALLSGQRLSKVIGLQKADVDLDAGQITIRDQRKGGKVKTSHQPISPALAGVLTEAMAASTGAHVFASGRSGKPYTRSGASTFFARLATEAGLTDFRFHDLRHTFATEARRSGAGLDVVQALLGHASPLTTARYAHLGRPELHAAASAVVALALPPAKPAPTAKKPKSASKKDARRAS
ncbi:MAG TPA: site-specific integrase [Polyangiaceae bacterium]|nr:site-specific integrase [Polyangiaceae bacterium]